MTTPLNLYQEHRDALLTEISVALANDKRFVAAWLSGSFGRNTADSVSDLDLTLVVAEIHSASLCLRLEQVSPTTSPERLALISQFGIPALIHENNNNAPKGGTFTFVLYADSAIMVDWVLIPIADAKRPEQSKLLFDKVGIPVSPPFEPEDLEQSKKSVAENWAFFWMMTAVTIKYIIRGDGVFVTQWIENLHNIIHTIERQLDRQPWSYIHGSLSQLQATRENQIQSITILCKKMQKLQLRVAEYTESELSLPLDEINKLLSIANQ